VVDKTKHCTYYYKLGANGVTEKEHQRNLKRIAKAIKASDERLRKAGIQFDVNHTK
jgi:hypothetical protein